MFPVFAWISRIELAGLAAKTIKSWPEQQAHQQQQAQAQEHQPEQQAHQQQMGFSALLMCRFALWKAIQDLEQLLRLFWVFLTYIYLSTLGPFGVIMRILSFGGAWGNCKYTIYTGILRNTTSTNRE